MIIVIAVVGVLSLVATVFVLCAFRIGAQSEHEARLDTGAFARKHQTSHQAYPPEKVRAAELRT